MTDAPALSVVTSFLVSPFSVGLGSPWLVPQEKEAGQANLSHTECGLYTPILDPGDYPGASIRHDRFFPSLIKELYAPSTKYRVTISDVILAAAASHQSTLNTTLYGERLNTVS